MEAFTKCFMEGAMRTIVRLAFASGILLIASLSSTLATTIPSNVTRYLVNNGQPESFNGFTVLFEPFAGRCPCNNANFFLGFLTVINGGSNFSGTRTGLFDAHVDFQTPILGEERLVLVGDQVTNVAPIEGYNTVIEANGQISYTARVTPNTSGSAIADSDGVSFSYGDARGIATAWVPEGSIATFRLFGSTTSPLRFGGIHPHDDIGFVTQGIDPSGPLYEPTNADLLALERSYLQPDEIGDLVEVGAVPLPASLPLIGFGVLFLVGLRRFRVTTNLFAV